MTWRVVPLGSMEAEDARLGADATERLRMMTELSILAWVSSGRPFPEYTRATMPVRKFRLSDPGGIDDARTIDDR